jgi:hypothetical protein
MKKIIFQLKRVAFDLCMLAIVGIFLFIFSKDTQGAGQMFLFKALLVSAGFLHAHIIRKLAFPYIDFNKTKDAQQKWLVIAIYVVVILGWTRGG